MLGTGQTSSELALISSLDAGLLLSPGFAALMQATHQATMLLLVVQAIPPEPPLVLVAPLLKLIQVTHQVLVLLLAGALWLLQATADLTQVSQQVS